MTPIEEATTPQTSLPRLWALLGIQSERGEDPTSVFQVRLQRYGGQKIPAIRALRRVLGINLREAKDLAESAPCLIPRELTLQDAVELVLSLSRLGGQVSIEGLHAAHDVALCRLLAKHPNASPRLLTCLLLSNDASIQETIAKNPHLPIALLAIVAPMQPRAFLQNPVFPLLLLEDPLLKGLGDRVLMALLSLDERIHTLFPAALACFEASLFLAKSKAHLLSTEELMALVNHEDSDVLEAIGANPTIPEALKESMAVSARAELRAAVAANTRLPLPLLRALLDDEREEVRGNAISNHLLPIEWLPPYQEGASAVIYEALAFQKKTPALVLERLLDVSDYVSSLLAEHPNATAALLERLAQHPDEFTRHQVMCNPNSAKQTLALGLKDSAPGVREAAAEALRKRFGEGE